MGMGQDAAQLFASFSHRAILVLKDTIVPMSSEFTPETERQRLQHLVSDSSHPQIINLGQGGLVAGAKLSAATGAVSRIQLTALKCRRCSHPAWPLGCVFPLLFPLCSWECKSQHASRAQPCCSPLQKQSLSILCLCSLLQAFLFPKLLDGEFTRFEFPRRLKGDDVGQKVLYRDYFMEGWWVLCVWGQGHGTGQLYLLGAMECSRGCLNAELLSW